MPFSATINLGTVGVAITSVKLYGCTGTSGGNCTGCTALTGYENVSVSTFPLLVSGIPNGVRYIQAEALGACSADLVKQCISISGIPGPTATPVPTMTPTPTGTSAPGATPVPTMTPTPTGTSAPDATPNPTSTPTPTVTSGGGNCTITGQNSVSPGSPTQTGQIILQTTGRVMNLSVFGGASSGGSSSLTLTVVGSSFTPTPNPNSVTISANQNQTNTGTLVLPDTGTYNYTLSISTVGTSGNNGSFTCGNSYVGPTPTPSPTATTLPGCNSTVSRTYSSSGSTIQSVNLDFSGAANGSEISVQYTANDRPNRFNIYGGGSFVTSSLWAGSDTDYEGPWSGNQIDTDGSGYFSFIYNSSLSYELRVDVGGANPSNIIDDSWSVTFSCLGVPSATASPTATPTPSPTTPPLYGYFRSGGQSSVNTFCQNPGYVTTALWYSTGSTFSTAIAYTRVYEDTSYTPFNGSSLWYAVTQDDTFNTLTGGQFNAVQIDADGYIVSTALRDCTGGGNNNGGLT